MKMRKGFTLVELLIVIIIIGILAAAMLLSSGSGVDAGQVAANVAEMRALKAAAIMLAANTNGKLPKDTVIADFVGVLAANMDNADAIKAKYKVSWKDKKVTIELRTPPTAGSNLDKLMKSNKALNAKGHMVFDLDKE